MVAGVSDWEEEKGREVDFDGINFLIIANVSESHRTVASRDDVIVLRFR